VNGRKQFFYRDIQLLSSRGEIERIGGGFGAVLREIVVSEGTKEGT